MCDFPTCCCAVFRRPLAHLFGHVHDQNGVTKLQGVVFSNAALPVRPQPRVLDVYIEPDKAHVTNTQPVYADKQAPARCCLM